VSDHGAKIAAGRIGCTVEEYRRREASGQAWCTGHKDWHDRARFARSSDRANGLQAYCPEAHDDLVSRRRLFFPTPEGAAAARPVHPNHCDTASSGHIPDWLPAYIKRAETLGESHSPRCPCFLCASIREAIGHAPLMVTLPGIVTRDGRGREEAADVSAQ
jgi:hypothetical protein